MTEQIAIARFSNCPMVFTTPTKRTSSDPEGTLQRTQPQHRSTAWISIMRNLIVFASHEGQTEQIAERIQRRLREHSIPSDVLDVVQHPATEIHVESYDAVLIGSPMHYGRHDPRIRFFIEHNLASLHGIPTAFFSVSLASASKKRKDRVVAKRLANEFLQSTHWAPSMMDCFAGALKYSKYGWLKRQVMHRIALKAGAETSFAEDYDYTDWQRVNEFADRFATLIRTRRRSPERRARFSELRTPVRDHSLRRSRPKRRTTNLYHVVAKGDRQRGRVSHTALFRSTNSPQIALICAKRPKLKRGLAHVSRNRLRSGVTVVHQAARQAVATK